MLPLFRVLISFVYFFLSKFISCLFRSQGSCMLSLIRNQLEGILSLFRMLLCLLASSFWDKWILCSCIKLSTTVQQYVHNSPKEWKKSIMKNIKSFWGADNKLTYFVKSQVWKDLKFFCCLESDISDPTKTCYVFMKYYFDFV